MDRLIFPAQQNRRIYNWLFVAIVVFVIAFKFNDLFLPYFWDELGVYAPAVIYQSTHSLSLMPASVPVEFSRGHPLLFTFLYALIFKIFGNNVFVAHSFSLFISLLLLWVVFIKTRQYFSPVAAIVGVVLIAVQPVFLAQSSMVLPEIMLSLFTFLSLSNYYEKKYFLFALFASMAILTKESAIVLPVTVLVYSLVQWAIFKNNPDGLKPGNIILTFLPYGIFGIFLLIQKQQNGWYFFPYHIRSVSFDFDRFRHQFAYFFDFVFWEQGRYWCEKIIFIGVAVSLLTNKLNWRITEKNFFTMAGIFTLFFLMFSSLSFYMGRYVVVLLFPAFMAVAVSLTCINSNKIFITAVTLFLCIIAFEHREGEDFEYDNDLGYRRQVHTLQQAVDYVSESLKPGETTNGNFPAYYALYLTDGGYLKKEGLAACWINKTDVDYFLVSSQAPVAVIDRNKYGVTLLKVFKDGFAETKIYRIKEKQK